MVADGVIKQHEIQTLPLVPMLQRGNEEVGLKPGEVVNSRLAHPCMGQSWEGMVIEEIIRGLKTGFDYYYYRTGSGAEVDLILEGDFGLIPVEIKYAQTVPSRQLRGLKDFVRKACRFGIVINNDERPRLYDEKIIGIPFACL